MRLSREIPAESRHENGFRMERRLFVSRAGELWVSVDAAMDYAVACERFTHLTEGLSTAGSMLKSSTGGKIDRKNSGVPDQ